MRKILFLLFAFVTAWATQASAQAFQYPVFSDGDDLISVKCQGNSPAISDFVTAYLDFAQDEEFFSTVNDEWKNYRLKKPINKNGRFVIDTKNGYMSYSIENDGKDDNITMEMCFWNCADRKHKMVAVNTIWRLGNEYGWDEYTGCRFFLYDNVRKDMRTILPEDIGALYDGDGLSVFFLPRKGKNIKVSAAGGGERWNEILVWDGYQFHPK